MGQEMCKANPDMDGEKMQAIISKKWAVLPEKDEEKRRNSPKSYLLTYLLTLTMHPQWKSVNTCKHTIQIECNFSCNACDQ